jgi:precorrin-4 methylase
MEVLANAILASADKQAEALNNVASASVETTQTVEKLVKQLAAPKTVVRNSSGEITGVR